MAQVSYEDLMKSYEKKENKSNNSAIKWFSLKDGESAIVRIMYKAITDIDVVDIHECMINDKRAKVVCLRPSGDVGNYEESISKCPLCEAKIPVQRKLYTHLICYEANEKGEIVAVPKMWERNAFKSTFDSIANLFKDYGDLTQHIFKITRTGEKQSTKYSINYMPATMYPEAIYKKDESLFEGVTALKSVVRNYDYNKQLELITNNFRMPTQSTQQPVQHQVVNEQIRPYGVQPTPQAAYSNPAATQINTPEQEMSFDPSRQPAFQYNRPMAQAPLGSAIPTPQATYIKPQEESKPPWESDSDDGSTPFGRPTRN